MNRGKIAETELFLESRSKGTLDKHGPITEWYMSEAPGSREDRWKVDKQWSLVAPLPELHCYWCNLTAKTAKKKCRMPLPLDVHTITGYRK